MTPNYLALADALLCEAWRATPATLAAALTTRTMETGETVTAFRIPPHIDFIAGEVAAACYAGESARIIVCAPVRHGKSELLSHYTPVWYLHHWRERRVMLGTYESGFGRSWGRKVRNTIREHGRALDVHLAEDSQAADKWDTPQGGGMTTAGKDGGFTGKGANLLLLDDIIKNAEEANSLTIRDKAYEWLKSTALTRLEPNGICIITMARWHEDDPVGRLLNDEGGRWRLINIPAIAEPGDVLGRKPGEPLWPERFDLAALKERKRDAGQYYWDALYQQKPPPAAGDLAYGSFDPAEGRNVSKAVRPRRGHPLDLAVDFNRIPGMHGILGQYFPDQEMFTAFAVLHFPRMHIKNMIGKGDGPGNRIKGGLCDWIENVAGGWQWPVLRLFGDATGRRTNDSDGRTNWDVIIEELESCGIPYELNVPYANPGVIDRINHVNDAFLDAEGDLHYQIAPGESGAELLIRDYKNVKLENGALSKKHALFSHASDAEGYRIHWLRPIRRLSLGGGRVTTAG